MLGKKQTRNNDENHLFGSFCLLFYANHCVRATFVTQLAIKRISVSDIQVITGHKIADNIQGYMKHRYREKEKDIKCFV